MAQKGLAEKSGDLRGVTQRKNTQVGPDLPFQSQDPGNGKHNVSPWCLWETVRRPIQLEESGDKGAGVKVKGVKPEGFPSDPSGN